MTTTVALDGLKKWRTDLDNLLFAKSTYDQAKDRYDELAYNFERDWKPEVEKE